MNMLYMACIVVNALNNSFIITSDLIKIVDYFKVEQQKHGQSIE